MENRVNRFELLETLNQTQKERLLNWVANSNLEVTLRRSSFESVTRVPPHHSIRITCPPGGVEETFGLAFRLHERIDNVIIPHIAARRIKDDIQLMGIFDMLDLVGISDLFIVGGDGNIDGPYKSSIDIIHELKDSQILINSIGVGGYPEGHPYIKKDVLIQSLKEKEVFAKENGIQIYIVTQMCFDAATIKNWVSEIRGEGITMPIVVGVPGCLDDVSRLIEYSSKSGVGNSVKFLKSNPIVSLQIFKKSLNGYAPTGLLVEAAKFDESLGVTGLSFYTFNQINRTLGYITDLENGLRR